MRAGERRDSVFARLSDRDRGPVIRVAAAVALLVLAAVGGNARQVTHLSATGVVGGAAAGPLTGIFAGVVIAVACVGVAGLALLLAGRRRRGDQEGET